VKIILKKVVGIIFILMGCFLSLALLAQIPMAILRIKAEDSSEGYGVGYIMGTIIGAIILLVITVFLFKFGFKWVSNKTKPKKIESIDSIGE
jgi:uncharacterized membrane protein